MQIHILRSAARRVLGLLPLLLCSYNLVLAQQDANARKTTGSQCQVTNIVPSFLAYWDEYGSADSATQVKMFQQKVIAPNQAIYDGVLANVPMPLTDLISLSLAKAPQYIGAMHAMNKSISSQVPGHIASFQQSFPDFQCSTPIYFLYSMQAFDGAVRTVNGKPALMFGVDVIARTFGNDQQPLFAHELFHVYHSQVVQEDPDALYWSLWKEGLATYVSRSLSPGLPDSKICCFPDIQAVQPQVPKIAALLLEKLGSTTLEDNGRFFLGRQKNLDIPERSGYYIGYLIAKQLGQTRSLQQLAALQPAKVRKLEEQELKQMKNSP